MPLSRRSFVRALSLTGAGVAAAPLAPMLGARGREAWAADLRRGLAEPGAGLAAKVIRLSSNENPRGPSAAALEGIQRALVNAPLYPYASAEAVRTAIARHLKVPAECVILGCGSTEILRMVVDTYTSPTKALVAGNPTFELPGMRATTMKTPVHAVPVDAKLQLDLGAMAARSRGAGLVFLNNPNNPTGTVYGAQAVADFIREVHRVSPETVVLVDEAYHEYVDDPSYRTAIPTALEDPRVIVARTFSKAYGLAGLRVGYAVARRETVTALDAQQLDHGVNALAAGAAIAALGDADLPARERKLNAEARDFTRKFFEGAGYAVTPSHTNFLMADIRRDARWFQDECRKHDVLVGRPFPPLATHARVSIGTMDEMRAAVPVFERVLGTRKS